MLDVFGGLHARGRQLVLQAIACIWNDLGIRAAVIEFSFDLRARDEARSLT